jgi:predicted DNA-binding transcriptional regulator AlpA
LKQVIDGQKRILAFQRRGLSRIEAASYIGISPTKFDQLVTNGRMPQAKQIDGRKVWDVRELDPAFEELGSIDTSWEDVREGQKIS